MAKDQYYEGILQLRNPTKELIDFVRWDVKRKGDVSVAKQVKVVNGIDFYISDQRYTLGLGRRLQRQFKGELKTSKKLYSMDRFTGKRIYRVTVLFRLPKFKKGDIVKWKGKKIRIRFLGKKVSGVELETGKKVSFGYGEIG